MGNPLLTMTSKMMCGHGGTAMPTAAAKKVTLSGVPAVLASTQLDVTGCTNMILSETPAPLGPNTPNLPIRNYCLPSPLGQSHQSTRVTSMGMPLAMKGPGNATDKTALVPISSGTAPPPAVTIVWGLPKPISLNDAGQSKVTVI